MKKFLSILCLFCFTSGILPVQALTVKSNTVVPINIENRETSKTVVAGGSINAEIAEDVYINNTLVFKEGDKAFLNVLSAKKAGFVGIPGEMVISGGKVYDTKGVAHRIDYNTQIVGEEKTWPKVMVGCGVFIILAPLALFGFVKGGQAEIMPTQIINTKITNDFVY